MSQTLLEIGEDFRALDDLIHENEGNLDNPAVVEALKTLESEIAGNLESKVDNYAAYIKELIGRAETREGEAKRMAALVRTDKNAAKRLADRLRFILDMLGIDRVNTPRFRVGVVNNGGHLPLHVDCDPMDLPEIYRQVHTVVEPDNEAIRAALAAGVEIPGCALGERGRRLVIK